VTSVRTALQQDAHREVAVSCVAPTITQTFKLFFSNTEPPIAGDATFQNVPVGIDPTTWPLDIDREATEREAKKNPLYPGGTVKLFGNFCWGGNAQRAELYMVPEPTAGAHVAAGRQHRRREEGAANADRGRNARQIRERGRHRGRVRSARQRQVPLGQERRDDRAAHRLRQPGAKRASAVTADKIITLKAQEAPLPFLLIGGATFGGWCGAPPVSSCPSRAAAGRSAARRLLRLGP
jgi:hypothetical protein